MDLGKRQKFEMQHHHVMFITSDVEESIKLFRDVLGFELVNQFDWPDGIYGGNTDVVIPGMVSIQAMDELTMVKGYRAKCALLTSPNGANIELQQPIDAEVTPAKYLTYKATSARETAFFVEDIDHWFKRIRDAGYKTTTEYVWGQDAEGNGGSFLFFDHDGNIIQLFAGTSTWSGQ